MIKLLSGSAFSTPLQQGRHGREWHHLRLGSARKVYIHGIDLAVDAMSHFLSLHLMLRAPACDKGISLPTRAPAQGCITAVADVHPRSCTTSVGALKNIHMRMPHHNIRHNFPYPCTKDPQVRPPTHLVGGDAQAARARGGALRQHGVDEREELLHDGVLAQVVVARLDQVPVPRPGAAPGQARQGFLGLGFSCRCRAPALCPAKQAPACHFLGYAAPTGAGQQQVRPEPLH